MLFDFFPSSKPGLHSQTDSEERKTFCSRAKNRNKLAAFVGERENRSRRRAKAQDDSLGWNVNRGRVNIDIESLRVEQESPSPHRFHAIIFI
jgi:hypothetical protein